jgi:heme-degrading monooxygenase HmoA
MKYPVTFIIPPVQDMPCHMLVHYEVRDFGKWKPFFERFESTRKTSGSKSAQVFQNSEDPADVFILFEWDSVENAQNFNRSLGFKKDQGTGRCNWHSTYSHPLKMFRKIKPDH